MFTAAGERLLKGRGNSIPIEYSCYTCVFWDKKNAVIHRNRYAVAACTYDECATLTYDEMEAKYAAKPLPPQVNQLIREEFHFCSNYIEQSTKLRVVNGGKT